MVFSVKTTTRRVTRVGKRNQVTIPAAMLRALGVSPGDRVELAFDCGEIRLKKAEDPIARAYGLLKRPGQRALSIEELEALIAEANRERGEQAYERDLATKSRV